MTVVNINRTREPELIRLPVDASRADFAPHVFQGEVHELISTTISGRQYVVARPGLYEVGQVVVKFVRVSSGGRRDSVHEGFRKAIAGRITGTGEVYSKERRQLVNYYFE